MDLVQVESLARRLPEFESAKEMRISFLASGITNQNYRLVVNGDSFVIRIPGTNTELLGIARDREAHNHSVAANAGVAPGVIALIKPEGCLVTRFIDGERISPDEMRSPSRIHDICHSLHAIHDGIEFAGTFSPFRATESYLSIARAERGALPRDIAHLERVAEEIECALYEGMPLRPRPIHADLLNENLIDDGSVIRILDWEYSGMGDVFFDFGNLADHLGFTERDERALLSEYFGEFRKSDAAHLKLMRIMSDFREAMWGIVQGAISTLDFDFATYANEFFVRMKRQASDPRYPRWLLSAAGGP